HGLGLWDCLSCKKKRTIMSGFPGRDKDNGLAAPSRCDLATVRDIYHQERLVARANPKPNSIAAGEVGAATSSRPVAQTDSNQPSGSLFRFSAPAERLALPRAASRDSHVLPLFSRFSGTSVSSFDLNPHRALPPRTAGRFF